MPLDDRCMARAVELGATYGVRIVDAIHLAAADRLPGPVRYLTFDRRQIPAADALGFEVVSPIGAVAAREQAVEHRRGLVGVVDGDDEALATAELRARSPSPGPQDPRLPG